MIVATGSRHYLHKLGSGTKKIIQLLRPSFDFQALPNTIEEYRRLRAEKATPYQNSALWAAMNEDLDTGVGMILDKIDSLGIADNTYVIYTSDNGYESKLDVGKPVRERTFGKAHPLLSHKYMLNEGGIRVPFIVRGPGIPAGVASRTPVSGTDIFPTILDIVGHGDKTPKVVEGGSLLPLLRSGGLEGVNRKDSFFVFRYTPFGSVLDIAIVQDDYKLLKEISSNTLHLWNVSTDLGEQENLVDQQPERAKNLYDALTQYLEDVDWAEADASQIQWRRVLPRR